MAWKEHEEESTNTCFVVFKGSVKLMENVFLLFVLVVN